MIEVKDETTGVPKSEVPSEEDLMQYFDELDQRGVLVEAECTNCDSTTETRVLPEENDGPHFSLCTSCMESHLRAQGML